MVPPIRITGLNDREPNPQGDFVLYCMTAFRRSEWNFSLDRALQLCQQLQKPLLVLEMLKSDYRWHSARFHDFILRGMADNQLVFQKNGISYFPYVEHQAGAAAGLTDQLVARSCLTIVDDFPCFFLPAWNRLLARKSPVRVEMIDSNGLLPMRAADKVHSRAHFFRTFLQKTLTHHLIEFPSPTPFEDFQFPRSPLDLEHEKKRWCPADFSDISGLISSLPVNQQVPAISNAGGSRRAKTILQEFAEHKLQHYPEDRNSPQKNGTSGLSPYLHFGHLSSHQLFHEIMTADGWHPGKIAPQPTKKAEGWWGVSAQLEPFLDQLTTWREIGFNMAWQKPRFDRFESLPAWAQTTLNQHQSDPREFSYSLEEFENSLTHDPLWNAAQNQLKRDGMIHNYLRMLWGKKILHWSSSPRTALAIMIELNNKYALDGRNPNSYSGIFWTLGRYDRAWGPERPVFGKIRYMTSENTARKHRVKEYIKKYQR
jgi:deoxyribodipyrimidine photo-lyase